MEKRAPNNDAKRLESAENTMQRAIQLRPTTTNRLGLATLDVSQSVKSVRLSVSCLILCYVSEKFLSSMNYSPFSEQVGWPFRGSRADIQSARLWPSGLLFLF